LPNIAVVLKEEIARLARKEVRSQTQKLHKAAAQYRRDIAALKRQTSALHAQLISLDRKSRKLAPSAAAEPLAQGKRFTAKGVRSHRGMLGFSAADYGKLVGVTGHTIYKWEQGGARPRQAQLAKLVSVRGLRKREALKRLSDLSSKASKPRGRKRRQ
jgi:DNA-binding transcriptional regulator YiaG